MRQACPIGGHAVSRGDGSQGDSLFVGAKIAHDADGLDRKQHGKRLPDIAVDAEIVKLLDKDAIGPLQQLDLFRCDIAEYADAKAGSRKWMTLKDLVGNSKILADHTHLVLKKLAKRLDDAELAIIDKRRPRPNESKVMNIIGEVAGKTCVMIDDLVDTAGTLCQAAQALKEEGRYWVQAEYQRRMDPQLDLQEDLKGLMQAPPGAVVRILDVGAGPLTNVGKRWEGRTVELVPVDPLASEYKAILMRLKLRPPVLTEPADGENLVEKFEKNSFDLVCAYNSLDHSQDPLKAIQQMFADQTANKLMASSSMIQAITC